MDDTASALRHAPAVSVVLPCRNEVVYIEGCLRSILGQEEPAGGYEVVVADGRSIDGTWEILSAVASREEKLRVIDNPGQIVASGLNAAIKTSRGGIIIRMDAHTTYAPDYLKQCVEALKQTQADNVGGPARTAAKTFLQRAVAAAYHSPFAVGGARFHDVNYEGSVDTVTYGCWRRDAFDQFGYFDEELVRNQDDEHNLRIIRGGGKIWQSPKIKSWYRPRNSITALFNQYMQYGYWKVRVIQKHKLPASPRHLVPGAFLLMLVLLAVASLVSTPTLWLLLGLAGTYSLATLVASFEAARRTEWRLLPVLPAIFACYHFGYGYGFLRGFWDFVICRRAPKPAFAALTR